MMFPSPINQFPKKNKTRLPFLLMSIPNRPALSVLAATTGISALVAKNPARETSAETATARSMPRSRTRTMGASATSEQTRPRSATVRGRAEAASLKECSDDAAAEAAGGGAGGGFEAAALPLPDDRRFDAAAIVFFFVVVVFFARRNDNGTIFFSLFEKRISATSKGGGCENRSGSHPVALSRRFFFPLSRSVGRLSVS